MDLRIVADTADRFAVQASHGQAGDVWIVVGGFGIASLLCFEIWKRGGWRRKLGWILEGGALLVFVWFMGSIWVTGGIRFDLAMDRRTETWTTDAIYPKQGEYLHEPVTRSLGDILRVDMTVQDSSGKGGGRGTQRILITLQNGTTFEPFEGEDRGSANEYLVLDRMQKMLVRR